MLSNIRGKIEYYRQHWFVRQAFTLQAGNLIETMTQAVVGIFLARLLQPERFGVYSLSMSLASLLSILLATGVQDAASSLLGASYTKKDEKEIFNIFRFLFGITIITSLISLTLIFFAPLISAKYYHNSMIGFYAMIVVLAGIISNSFFSFSTIALQITGRIQDMMSLGVVDQVTRWSLSLILVLLGFGIAGAVSAHLIGAMIVFIISVVVWEKIKRSNPILPSIRNLIHGSKIDYKKYFGFSFWVALDRNISMLYMILPVLIVGAYVTVSEVSFFKLAFGYINLIMSLLGPISILLNVEFPKMQAGETHRLRQNFVRVSLYAMALSALLTAGGVIAAPILFKIIYGSRFLPSIKYIFGFFVYGAFYGIGIGLGPMWRAVNRVKVSILINIVTLAAGIPLGLWLVANFAIWGAVIMVTLWFTISHLISFIYLSRKLET